MPNQHDLNDSLELSSIDNPNPILDSIKCRNGTSDQRSRSVRFSNVEIREYEITLDDHPETSNGPSISLGWKYNKLISFKVQTFELIKNAKGRRDLNDLLLSQWERENLLFNFGYSRAEINKSLKNKEKFKSQTKSIMKIWRSLLNLVHDTQGKVCQTKSCTLKPSFVFKSKTKLFSNIHIT